MSPVRHVPRDYFTANSSFDRAADYKPHEILLRLLAPAEWMDRARCADPQRADTRYVDELMFTESSGTHADSERKLKMAQRMCGLCPVRVECLGHALAIERTEVNRSGQREAFGVFGGITAAERISTIGLPPEERVTALQALWRAVEPTVLLPSEREAS